MFAARAQRSAIAKDAPPKLSPAGAAKTAPAGPTPLLYTLAFRNAIAAAGTSGNGSSTIQRKCAACDQEEEGKAQRKAADAGAQAKLTVSQPDDPYEREADEVADRIVQSAAPPTGVAGDRAASTLAPAGAAVQRRAHGAVRPLSRTGGADALVSSPGEPLDPTTHDFMASRFGADFSDVRVHHGGEASRSASELNAAAYTVGTDVVFGAGRYQPLASEGRRLLAHELTHVLQQSAASEAPRTAQRGPADEIPAYDVDDAIAQLNVALAAAEVALKDSSVPAAQKTKITAQQQKLKPLLAELRDKGDKATLAFDPNPKLNEVHPGDSGRTLAALYGGTAPPHAPASLPVSANENPDRGAGPKAVQAFALPGGLRITPMTAPVVQRFVFIALGVVVLAGLLLSGCSKPTPACVPPPVPTGGFPLTIKPIIAKGTVWDTESAQRGYIGVRTAWAKATWKKLAQVEITVAAEEVQPVAKEAMQPTLSSIASTYGGSKSTIVVIFLRKTCKDVGLTTLCPEALTSRGNPPAIGMPEIRGDGTAVGQFETSLGHELGHVLIRGEHSVSGLLQQSGPYPDTLTADEICTAQKYF